jgi:DNA topoisomerase I
MGEEIKEELQNDEEYGLIHVSLDEPGFTRRRKGKAFAYYDDQDQLITDKQIIERIKRLGIPPMWEKVWICPWANGYLQATGLDARKRKQYIYHPDWTSYQQSSKFLKLSEFAYALPGIRNTIEMNLRKQGWKREKVLSLVLAILDEHYLRVGNRRYFQQNETHGLTTLRRKHLVAEGRNIAIRFKGKSHKFHNVQIRNPRLRKLVIACSELRGYELFKYLDEEGKVVPVDSKDVNDFLREISGQDFTSKFFRTWGGTVLAVKNFPKAMERKQQNPRIKLEREIVKQVADELNNTVAVCRTYYIHPSVLLSLNEDFSPDDYDTSNQPRELSQEERLVLSVIEKAQSSQVIA